MWVKFITPWVLGLALATVAECQVAAATDDGLVELQIDQNLTVVTLPNPRCGGRKLLAEFTIGQAQSVKIGFTSFFPSGTTLRVTADDMSFDLGEMTYYPVRQSRCANLVVGSGAGVGVPRFLQIANAKTIRFFVGGVAMDVDPNDIDLLRRMATRLKDTP